MSEILTKETVSQTLLEGIQKAVETGNAKDAKELTAAHCMLEQSELKQTSEADEYAIKCTELEQKDEELKVQREELEIRQKELEARKEAEIQKAVAQKVSARTAAIFGFLGAGVMAAGTIVVSVLTGRNELERENRRNGMTLEFQRRHFQAQKDDDLVTRYSDENFKPR